MIKKSYFTLIALFFLYSCSQIDFVYKDSRNLTNPIYNKTQYSFSGIDISSSYRYSTKYFGSTKTPSYNLKINIEEEKVKRSVQSSQAVSKLDYELTFEYALSDKEKDCLVYKDILISRFSYVPKSSGYNFGSDRSLDKMYELAANNNFYNFIRSISEESISVCLDEG